MAGALAGLVLLAALLVLSVFADELLGPLVVERMRRQAAAAGYDLQVASLRGVLARETLLSGVSLRARAEDAPLRALAVDQAGVVASLWGLARGRDDAISSLRASGASVELALDGPSPGASGSRSARAPAMLPALAVDGLDLHCRLAERRAITVRDARLHVGAPAAAGAGQPVALDAPSCVLTGLPAGTRGAALAARGAWADGSLALDELTVDGQPLLAGSRVDLPTRTRDAWRWELHATWLAGTLALSGGVADGTLETRVEARGLSIARAGALWDPAGAAHGEGPSGRLDAEGELVVPGVFDLDGGPGGWLARARGELHLSASELRVPDAAVRLAPAGPDGALALGPRAAELRVALLGGALQLSDGLLETPGGRLRLRHGRVTLDAPTLAEQVVELDGEADFPDLSALGAVFGGPAWGGRLAGTVRVGGPLSEWLADVEFSGEDVLVAGRPLGRVSVVARADRRTLEVVALRIEGEALDLRAGGRLHLEDATLEDVVVQGELRGGARALLPGVAGTVTLVLTSEGPLGDPSARVDVTGEDVKLGGVALRSLRLRAAHERGLLDVDLLELSGEDGTLVAAGTLEHAADAPVRIGLERLLLAHGEAELALEQPLGATWTDGVLRAAPCVLSGSGGRLELDWSAPLPDPTSGAGEVRLALREVVPPPLLLRWLPGGWRTGRIDGELHLGSVDDGSGERVLAGSLGLASLECDLPGADARAVGNAALGLELRGTRTQPRGRVELRVRDMYVEHGGGAREGPGELVAELELREGLDVRSLRITGPGGMTLEGDGRVGGWDAQAPLDLRLTMAETDIAFLGPLIGDVRRLGGRVGGELALRGMLGAPAVSGRVELNDGELRLSGAFPPLDEVTARAVLGPDGARIEELHGELGGAPFTAQGTLVRGPGGPRLELTLAGEDLLLYRKDGVKLRADAELTIAGPLDGPTASGSLVLRDSRLARHVNLLHLAQGGGPERQRGFQLFEFTEPPLDTLRFDVRVRAGEPFEVATNVASGGLRPELHLTGTGRTPVLVGTVYVDPSRLSLPGGIVRVTSGRVLFEAADPFVPRLQLDARARQRGYEITIAVTGPYDEPVVALSSVPPLPGDQLVLLLLTGQPPADESFGGAGSGADRFAVYIGQDLMARWMGSEAGPGSDALLDRLELEVAGDVTVSGKDAMQVSYRLTDRPREEGPITSLRAERDVYDKVNFGIQFMVRRP